MKKHLKKYIIPHEENEYRPHILRGAAVTIIALVVLAGFVFTSIHTFVLLNSSDFLAAVLPRVLVDLTNEDRENNSLAGLTVNPVLEAAAQLKADHMAEHSYFAHVSPDGTTPWHWFIEAGYSFVAAGENLAVNFSDSEDVEEAWMDSPGHRENILNGQFTEIGIATARGKYKGQNTIFVVQLFGTPAIATATPVPPVVASVPVEDIPQEEPIPAVAAGNAPAPETKIEVVELPEPVDVVPSEEVLVEEPKTLEVIHEDNMFVAVRDPEAVPENRELAGAEAAGLLAPQQSTFMERLFAQPATLLQNFYFILGGLILLVLIIGIVVEIERQHPKHIIYGVLLLALIVALAYVYRGFIFSELLII